MKQAWTDLKSFITIVLTITLIMLTLIFAIKGNADTFQIVFTLFSNVTTSVVTYFFAKKVDTEKTENSNENESEEK